MNTSNPRQRRLRSSAKWVLARVLWSTGLLALAKWWIRRHGAVVLSFHRILSRKAYSETTIQKGMIVTDETFAALLRYLQKHYAPIDLGHGYQQAQQKRVKVALTFDDGWEDNASTAFPIATEFKIPFTIFICPGLIDRSLPFWPERVGALIRSAGCSSDGIKSLSSVLAVAGYPDWAAVLKQGDGNCSDRLIEQLKKLPTRSRDEVLEMLFSCGISIQVGVTSDLDRTMSWSQVRHLNECGVTFGSHTQHHEILPLIPLDRVKEEIADSKKTIQEQLAQECFLFSYPNGDVSPEVRAVVSRSGIHLAFVNSPGVWRHDGDPFLIPRINVWENHLVGLNGKFSPLEFEYSVFWRAFLHGRRSQSIKEATDVTAESGGSALCQSSVSTLQADSASMSSASSNERAGKPE